MRACTAATCRRGLACRRSGTAARASVSGGGAPPTAPSPPPTRRLPPPPPSLAYLLRTGRTSNAAHAVWAALLADRPPTSRPAYAVDATAGLGGDTVGLARALGPTGRVLSLDLSPDALAATAAALASAAGDAASSPLAPARLVRACHSTLGDLLGGEQVDLVAFNLGYLPAAGAAAVEAASTSTRPETTMIALGAAVAALAPGGAVTVASYVGHAGGAEEAAAVSGWLETLDQRAYVVSETRLSNRPQAPRLSVVYRKG